MTQLGLSDIRVLDLTDGIAGAYCCHLLSDAGADVVKIEPSEGDPSRRWTAVGVELPPDEDGALFRYLHHGTRSVVGDGAAEEARRLLAHADLVLESGQLDDDRIDELRRERPEVVIVSVTPYGRSGPYAGRPATDFTVQAESGTLLFRGPAELPPFQHGGRISEWISGTFAAVVALASMRRAMRTGIGDHIDLSMLEVMAIAGSGHLEYSYQLQGCPAIEGPCRTQETPSIEPTRDGYVGFCTNSREQFDNFLVLIERTDLLGNEDWPRAAYRRPRLREWSRIVHDWTTRHTTAEVLALASELRVPVAPVNDAPGAVEFEHFRERNVFQSDPTGTFVLPRRPWHVEGQAPPLCRPSPRIGEHSGTVEWPARPRREPLQPLGLPLDGVRVVDLTAWWAGPMANCVLAALGADVVHVESVTRIDGMRTTGAGAAQPGPRWWERSTRFLCANTNKRGITLDLGTEDGLELFRSLVAESDAVIENFSPRVMQNFGLEWSALRAVNPKLVFVRMPAFGLSGPWRDNVGFAQTMEQVTGLAWITGHRSDQPRVQQGPSDPNAGLHAAFALIAALIERERTGIGVQVEVPMVEGALAVAAEPIVEWSAYGIGAERNGNRTPNAAPQGLYPGPGEDSWLAISIATDEQWLALAKVTGHPEWAADPGLGTVEARFQRQDELDTHLARWAGEIPVDEATELLVRAGIPAASARDPRRLLEHPQLRARGYHEDISHPEVGRRATPAMPFRSEHVDRWLQRAAPTLGQHNHEILVDDLGVSESDYEELRARGVIGTTPAT